ncbi:hypothetical protein BGX30_008681 [Mortierella sp. GBA39]|nr:hypothetical protein BGX30_008681 [Mortierella sp. GBA39]
MRSANDKKPLPAHHDPKGNGFVNPWPSFIRHGRLATFQAIVFDFDRKQAAVTPQTQLPKILSINKDLIDTFSRPQEPQSPAGTGHGQITTTWLGHACFLVQVDGVNILFDPVFSDRCSPSQLAGPKRITPPPCKLDELPRIDIVVISHNHYDHLDLTTIQRLQNDHKPFFYVPLGNKAWFHSIGIKDKVTECDWTEGVKPTKVFFGGDTGYRYVPKGADENAMPHCPAFKEIGDRIGPFDLSMIPIGAYSPRWFMSPIHCSPEDAVRVHEDIKSKRSVGMHWGTWILTDEDVSEPPKRLEAEMKSRGHDPNSFNVVSIGETLVVDV